MYECKHGAMKHQVGTKHDGTAYDGYFCGSPRWVQPKCPPYILTDGSYQLPVKPSAPAAIAIAPPERAVEASSPRGPGRPKGTTKDPLEPFAQKVALDDDHLMWVDNITGSGQPQVWFKGKNVNGKYAAYCLLVEDIDFGPMVLSDCGEALCVDPDCLYVDDRPVPKKCVNGFHPQVGNWSFTIGPKTFCRGCEVYFCASNGLETQVGGYALQSFRGQPQYDSMVLEYAEAVHSQPALIQAEADKALSNYLRDRNQKGKGADAQRLAGLQALADGTQISLYRADWGKTDPDL